MNDRFFRAFLPVGLAMGLAAVSLTAYVAKAQSNTADINDMAGSWIFNLSRTLPSPLRVLALGTFSKDGTFVGTAQGDGICCPAEGPAHGAWTRTGHNTFALTFNALWYQADTSLFGVLKVNMFLTLDERLGKVTGMFRGELVDPNGNVIFPVQGTLTGQRIHIK